jgi:hypothetical protein
VVHDDIGIGDTVHGVEKFTYFQDGGIRDFRPKNEYSTVIRFTFLSFNLRVLIPNAARAFASWRF